MFVVYGARSSGRVYTDANELVSTVFFHVFFVPLIPLRSLVVRRKRLLTDEGLAIPLNKKSILAGYLRHALFGVLCLGFAMAFDGLFLDSTVATDTWTPLAVGTSIFVVASFLWLLAMFVLGSKSNPETFWESSPARTAGGFSCLLAVLALMFGAAELIPKKPNLASIAADQTTTDEEAIRKLATTVLPRDANITVLRNGQGVEMRASYVSDRNPRVTTLAEQGKSDAAKIHKASAVTTLMFHAKDIVEHGRSRHLSKVSMSLAVTVLGHDGQPCQVEAYSVTIPRKKFNDLMTTKVTQKMLFSTDSVFEQLGVVDVDNFSKIEYRPRQ